ncbi:MAG: hypothetical protein ABWK15_09705 [Dissulfuribacterales bacterium]
MPTEQELFRKVSKLLTDMIILADEGDEFCQHDHCHLLFSIIRDSAYRVKQELERQKQLYALCVHK